MTKIDEDLKLIKDIAIQKAMAWHITDNDKKNLKEAVERINKLAEDVL